MVQQAVAVVVAVVVAAVVAADVCCPSGGGTPGAVHIELVWCGVP